MMAGPYRIAAERPTLLEPVAADAAEPTPAADGDIEWIASGCEYDAPEVIDVPPLPWLLLGSAIVGVVVMAGLFGLLDWWISS
jgi:hypothetical protein